MVLSLLPLFSQLKVSEYGKVSPTIKLGPHPHVSLTLIILHRHCQRLISQMGLALFRLTVLYIMLSMNFNNPMYWIWIVNENIFMNK